MAKKLTQDPDYFPDGCGNMVISDLIGDIMWAQSVTVVNDIGDIYDTDEDEKIFARAIIEYTNQNSLDDLWLSPAEEALVLKVLNS